MAPELCIFSLELIVIQMLIQVFNENGFTSQLIDQNVDINGVCDPIIPSAEDIDVLWVNPRDVIIGSRFLSVDLSIDIRTTAKVREILRHYSLSDVW